jgi:hypothetical protein
MQNCKFFLQIDENDHLPKFICAHCLGYLQHAYNLHVQIKSTSDNLKEVIRLNNTSSNTIFEPVLANQHPTSSININENQLEIIEHNEQVDAENYWYFYN